MGVLPAPPLSSPALDLATAMALLGRHCQYTCHRLRSRHRKNRKTMSRGAGLDPATLNSAPDLPCFMSNLWDCLGLRNDSASSGFSPCHPAPFPREDSPSLFPLQASFLPLCFQAVSLLLSPPSLPADHQSQQGEPAVPKNEGCRRQLALAPGPGSRQQPLGRAQGQLATHSFFLSLNSSPGAQADTALLLGLR